MRTKFFRLLITASLLQALVRGAEPSENPHPGQESSSESTYIPATLEVPTFIPPAPVAMKPLPEMWIDSKVADTRGPRTLTLIRGSASTLPDIPAPPLPSPVETRSLTPEELAKASEARNHQLMLGATVLDHRVSIVHWSDAESGESFEAVCGFDIGLLAGIGDLVHDGESYSLFLLHTHLDTTGFPDAAASPYQDLPDVEDAVVIFTKGDPKNIRGTNPITVVNDLIHAEKPRLTAYQEKRRLFQVDAEAWKKAHPTQPKDETIWLRPHRGSRYLTNPNPDSSTR